MKLFHYLFAILISYSTVSTLMFTSTRDQLLECRTQKNIIPDTLKVPVEIIPLIDSSFVDTTIIHFGNHPGSITWDTMIVHCEIKTDTIKKFYQKTW